MSRLTENALATDAQISYIHKLKSKTRSDIRIPIPLYKRRASKIITELRDLRHHLNTTGAFDSNCYEDGYEESSWSNFMWGCF